MEACTNQKYTNYGLSEAGSNIVYVAMTQVHNRAVMQQSTRYYIIYFHFVFYIYAFILTTSIYSNYPIYMSYYLLCMIILSLTLFALITESDNPTRMRTTGRCKGYHDVGQCFLPMHMANIIGQCKNSLSLL